MSYSYDVHGFKQAFESQFIWLNGFLRNVLRKPQKPALICPLKEKIWTYHELNCEANRLANALRGQGLQRGQTVMYMLLNSVEFALSYIACHKLRCVGAPVNYRLSSGELSLLIEKTAPEVFIYDADFEEAVSAALEKLPQKPKLILRTDFYGQTALKEGVTDWQAFLDKQSTNDPVLDAPANIYEETTRFFTSGTTNLPKSVPVNDINETLSAHDVLMHFPLNATDVTMNLTPWFHRGGLHAGGPTPALYCGATMILLRDFTPRLAMQYVSKYNITFLIGVPTIIDMLNRLQESNPCNISSLHGIVLMGAPLEKHACEKYMRNLTPNIFNGYGTTETFWNTFLRPYDLPQRSGSAGGPCTDDDVRVLRLTEPDQELPNPEEMVARDGKTVGEVAIMGIAKSTCTYYNNPELTAKKFKNGWIYTGDLATWDQDGYVSIIGRKDDMIVSAGENIYPTQVEAILNQHPKVEESLVLGIPDPKRGKLVVALIKASDPSLDEKELKQYCLSHPMLSDYKRPRIFRFVESLPHNATGKLLHKMPEGITF